MEISIVPKDELVRRQTHLGISHSNDVLVSNDDLLSDVYVVSYKWSLQSDLFRDDDRFSHHKKASM